jgi:hypothetical protein
VDYLLRYRVTGKEPSYFQEAAILQVIRL